MPTRRRPDPSHLAKSSTWHTRCLSVLDWGMEGLVALLLITAPWVVGGNLPVYTFAAASALGLLLLVWTLRQLVSWKLRLHRCPVSVLLVALFVVSAVMLVALPRRVIENVSPAAAYYYGRLLPGSPERTAEGPVAEELPFAPGTTLSLYPGATQTRLLELLAVLVLFVVVRHALASPDRLRRLAYLLVINGGALAVFGLWQKVRSPANTVYGLTVEGAQTFGPFINRNHFAMYVNCCICVGIGLFLSRLRRARGEYAATRGNRFEPTRYDNSLGEILQHPSAVWILVPLAVCVAAVLASLSRGGILALVAAMIAGFFALRRRGVSALIPVIAIPLVGLGLLAWYGLEPTLQRLDQEHFAAEGRFAIWRACWDAFLRFPAVGTGLGTFQYVEPLYRPATANQSVTHLHAHNEYLEALVEGGVVRLVLTVALVALVVVYGWRASRRLPRESDQLLAAGAWAACVAVAVHSLGEFGVHLTSIAALLAVLAAFVTALGASTQSREEDGTLIKYHYFGVGPILGGGVALTLGLALVSGSWRETQSELDRTAGLIRRSDGEGDAEKLRSAVEAMDAAIALAPSHFRLRMERYEIENQRLQAVAATNLAYLNRATPVLLATHAARSVVWAAGPLADLCDTLAAPVGEQAGLSRWYQHAYRDSWQQQARHLIAARNLCPLVWRPHLDIAQHVAGPKIVLTPENRDHYWAASDPQQQYLERIKLLVPNRAETWYLCGVQEGANGQRAVAIASWRRSLELSDEFLEPIVQQAARESEMSMMQPDLKLTTQEILQDLLPPESARSLVKAAWALYPKIIQVNERRPFLDKALALIEKDPAALEPENQYYYGLALWGLNKREQAAQHIREALSKATSKAPAWRLDLARLYLELQRFADAREQLGILLRESPTNPEVLSLEEKLDKAQRPQE